MNSSPHSLQLEKSPHSSEDLAQPKINKIIFLKVFIEFLTILLLFYVLIFWPHGMWDLSSPSDVEPAPPALRSPNYWTTWEVPTFLLLSKNMSHDRNSYLTVDYQVPVDRVAVCSLAQESTRVEIYRAHTSCRVLFIILF